MVWKRLRRARERKTQTWQRTDQAAVPFGAGRIWLADKDGNITRALGWTWRIVNRRYPGKYRWWVSRVSHAREPTPEAIAALKSLREAAG